MLWKSFKNEERVISVFFYIIICKSNTGFCK